MKRAIIKSEIEKSKGKAIGLYFEEHDTKEMFYHLSNFVGYAIVKGIEEANMDVIDKN